MFETSGEAVKINIISAAKIMDLKINKLICKIKVAFAGRKYPGDDHIVLFPDTSVPSDERDIFELLKGRHWDEISEQEYFRHEEALSFLEPEAFCFYLPGFLIATLNKPEDADVVLEHCIYCFDVRPDKQGRRTFNLPRIKLLNQCEKHVVMQYLTTIADMYPSESDFRMIANSFRKYGVGKGDKY